MQHFFIMLAIYLFPGNTPQNESIQISNTTSAVIYTTRADTGSLNGQWFLQPVLSSDTAAGKFPVLQINLPAHTFTGNTGCNSMRGSFQKTDTSLVFNQNIATTKMNCAGYDEAAFIKSLLSANRYKLDNGVLVLLFNATELSRWTRKPQRTVRMNKA